MAVLRPGAAAQRQQRASTRMLLLQRPTRGRSSTLLLQRTRATESNGASDADAVKAGAAAVGVKTPQQQHEAADEEPAVEAPSTPTAAVAAATGASTQSHPLALNADELFGAEELVEELKDASALGKRGEVYLAAQLLAVLFVVFPPFKLVGLFDLMATLALVAGLVFVVVGLFNLGRAFSPLPAPRKNHRLVTTGLYAHARHPLYGGLILAALGLAAVTRSEGRLALALVLWAVLERKAGFEEAALVARYGDAYRALQARTKRFVPWLY